MRNGIAAGPLPNINLPFAEEIARACAAAEDRFWNKVRRHPTGCWTWLAHQDKDGYGTFKINNPRRGVRAHRVSYLLTQGPIPPGMLICHTCDNPSCVRPSHLFLGTAQDNTRDCYAKQRDRFSRGKPFQNPVRGDRVNTARLNADKVRDVRARRLNGETLQSIGDFYGITKQSVKAICDRKNWRHIQ